MRILMVVRPAEGGMKEHVLALSAGIAATGHTVEIATPGDSHLALKARAAGFVVHPIPLVGPLRPLQDLLVTASLRRIIGARRLRCRSRARLQGWIGV